MTTASGKALPNSRAAQAAETRARLVTAAVELFSERDYGDVAVADIVKTAGVAHGLLFHYFGSKRGIYLAAMREASNALVRSHGLRPDVPAAQQVRHAVAAHLNYLSAHRGLALRLVLSGRGLDAESWAVFEEGRWLTIERWASLFGLDPTVPALRIMLRSAVGAIDEATVYWLQNGDPFEVDMLVECLVRIIATALSSAVSLDSSLEVDVGAAVQAILDPPSTSKRAT